MFNTSVVVGGGICGLMASILLKEKYREVFLIEQSDKVGGLFCSVTDSAGVSYDMGSHIPNSLQNEKLDELLFGPPSTRTEKWNVIEKLQSGNYFEGQWDLDSPFPDARHLDNRYYQTGCSELIQIPDLIDDKHIAQWADRNLGPTFCEHIVKPILGKLYGKHNDPYKLTMAAGLFGFTRILAFEPDIANQLKNLPSFDTRLGYQTKHHFDQRAERDGMTTPKYFYPKSGDGIESWVHYLLEKATSRGVKVMTSEGIERINVDNNKVSSVILKNSSSTIPTDLLFWSAPPFIALQAMEIEPSRFKPELRTAVVFHTNFDKPLLNQKSHYLWNWDKSSPIFRYTLYPNLSLQRNYNHVSSELLCCPNEVENFDLDFMVEHLKSVALVAKDAKCTSSFKQVIHNTFPVPTEEFENNNQRNYQSLYESADNIIISGRYGGKQWRQAEVLLSAYDDIQRHFG